MIDVLVCGSLHLDTVVHGRLPRTDETVMGEAVAYVCGGKGGNQAVAAARAGARTAMVGRVGDDAAGRQLRENLLGEGVDDALVATGSEPSGMSVAIVEPDGEYGAVVVSGANRHVEIGEVPPARVLVLQNEVPKEVNVAVARKARANGTFVIHNAAPWRDGASLKGLVDLEILNRVEALQACGVPIDTPEQALHALSAEWAMHPISCITLGSAGAAMGQGAQQAPGRKVHVPAPRVDVATTHGAGDTFVGVLAAAIAKGADPFDALPVAIWAAASYVSGRDSR